MQWLWYRSVAAAPIQPLAWEFPHASGAALKKQKSQKKKKKKGRKKREKEKRKKKKKEKKSRK